MKSAPEMEITRPGDKTMQKKTTGADVRSFCGWNLVQNSRVKAFASWFNDQPISGGLGMEKQFKIPR